MNLKKYYYPLLFLLYISVPRVVDASVIFSEIAWMGTPESANAEWIEFYNTSSEIIDMSGWKLYESGGSTLVYTFTKQIPGKTYFVLERVTPSAPDPLPDIGDEAGSFGGSGLSNSGEHLVLKNVEGTLVAEINSSSGWPAGESEDKKTMQRSNGTWITAVPTPKAPPQTGTVDGSLDISPPASSGSSPTTQPKPVVQRSTASFIQIKFPEQVFKGQQATFDFSVFKDGYEWLAGYFYWNMGDGTVYEFTKMQKVQHTYTDAGDYSVTVSFALTPYLEPLLMETTRVSVLDPSLELSLEKGGTTLLLSYKGEGLIDIGGWKVVSTDGEYTFPLRTRLLAGTVIRIKSGTPFAFNAASVFSLITAQQVEVASLGKVSQAIKKNRTSTYRSQLVASTIQAVQDKDLSQREELHTAPSAEESGEKKKPTSMIIFGGLLVILIGLFVYLDRKLGGKEEEQV